jgi:hypothetical protein
MSDDPTEAERRTKRRYAHELYPGPDEGEVRPLHIEVPHLYAVARGLDVWGTSWHDLLSKERPLDDRRHAADRIALMISAKEKAFLADALLQGKRLQDAWEWAMTRAGEESGEFVWERAMHYGVPVDDIKPYPCGPEPDHHDHKGRPLTGPLGGHIITPVKGPESECLECTEPVT